MNRTARITALEKVASLLMLFSNMKSPDLTVHSLVPL